MNAGCGSGSVFSSLHRGAIAGPSYPLQYADSLECLWRVSVPDERSRARLQLSDFDMRPASALTDISASTPSPPAAARVFGSCATELLEVYEGTDVDNQKLLLKICANAPGSILRVLIFSLQNILSTHFYLHLFCFQRSELFA